MYAEGSGLVENEVDALPRAIPVAPVSMSDQLQLEAGTSKPQDASSETACQDDDPVHELKRLKALFLQLKVDIGALEQSMEHEIPIRSRRISLQILKNKIDNIIDKGEVASLKSRAVMAETALEHERHRVFHLERQLLQADAAENKIETTKTRLLHCEAQVTEWRDRFTNAQTEIKELSFQLEHQALQYQSVHQSLAEANAEYQALSRKQEQSSEQSRIQVVELKQLLESEREMRRELREENRSLEDRLKNSAATLPDHKSEQMAQEREAAEPTPQQKQQTSSLPDPPLDESLPKLGELPPDATPTEDVDDKETPMESTPQSDTDRGRVAEEIAENSKVERWSWNVAGIWGYVTGDTA